MYTNFVFISKASHFLGAWLLCIPSQVSQSQTSPEQQAKFLLRAFGAMRLLRSRQRIIPDEASYRALMVACGRSKSDRRVELVKLFGLLRSDGIFPSAVTLGQYTRAIAEGFSRRSTGLTENDAYEDSIIDLEGNISIETALNALDRNLEVLEEAGRKWRQRPNGRDAATTNENPLDVTIDIENIDSAKEAFYDQNSISEYGILNDAKSYEPSPDKSVTTKMNKKSQHAWSPIMHSSSFVPIQILQPNLVQTDSPTQNSSLQKSDFMFLSLWSRVSSCESCNYVLLDEEVQAVSFVG